MGVLIVPAVFGAGVYQISRFIDLAFIRVLPDGSLTYMAMADRWNQLPLGIIGIALGTAILPALSRHISKAEDDEAVRLQANAIELAMLLTLPCAVALFFTGLAFVKAFMQGRGLHRRGRSNHGHGHIRAGGRPARLCVGQSADPQFLRPQGHSHPGLHRCSFAGGDGGAEPVACADAGRGRAGLGGRGGRMGQYLAVGRYSGATRIFRLPARVLGRIGRITLASGAMGAALWALMQVISPWLEGPFAMRMLAVGAIMAVSLVTYGAATVLLGVLDKATVQRLLRRQS